MSRTAGKRLYSFIATSVLVSSVVVGASAPAVAAAAVPTVQRFPGEDRYDTARLISARIGPTSTVVLARGDLYPDALAAAYVARLNDAAILLTRPDQLPAATDAALRAAGATRVIIMGGPSAVSPGIAMELAGRDLLVERIAGPTRFDTARSAAESGGAARVGTLDGRHTAFLASGANFPDAVSASPLAFAGRFPILLTTPESLSPASASAIAELGITQILLLGGTDAVSPAVEQQLRDGDLAVTRIGGANRSATSVAVTNFAIARMGFTNRRIGLVRGTDFADALTYGALAGRSRTTAAPAGTATVAQTGAAAPNGIVQSESDVNPGADALAFGCALPETEVDIPGGTAAISPLAEQAFTVNPCAGPPAPPVPPIAPVVPVAPGNPPIAPDQPAGVPTLPDFRGGGAPPPPPPPPPLPPPDITPPRLVSIQTGQTMSFVELTFNEPVCSSMSTDSTDITIVDDKGFAYTAIVSVAFPDCPSTSPEASGSVYLTGAFGDGQRIAADALTVTVTLTPEAGELTDAAGNSQTNSTLLTYTTNFPLIIGASYLEGGPNLGFGNDVGDELSLTMSQTVVLDLNESGKISGDRLSQVLGIEWPSSCAALASGSGTTTVVFTTTVACPSAITPGTLIPGGVSNTVQNINGGDFIGVNPSPAELSLTESPDVMPPRLVSIETGQQQGRITLRFDEDVCGSMSADSTDITIVDNEGSAYTDIGSHEFSGCGTADITVNVFLTGWLEGQPGGQRIAADARTVTVTLTPEAGELTDLAGNSQTNPMLLSYTTTFPLIIGATYDEGGSNPGFGNDIGDILALRMSQAVRTPGGVDGGVMGNITGLSFGTPEGAPCGANLAAVDPTTVRFVITAACPNGVEEGTAIPGGVTELIQNVNGGDWQGVNPSPVALVFANGELIPPGFTTGNVPAGATTVTFVGTEAIDPTTLDMVGPDFDDIDCSRCTVTGVAISGNDIVVTTLPLDVGNRVTLLSNSVTDPTGNPGPVAEVEAIALDVTPPRLLRVVTGQQFAYLALVFDEAVCGSIAGDGTDIEISDDLGNTYTSGTPWALLPRPPCPNDGSWSDVMIVELSGYRDRVNGEKIALGAASVTVTLRLEAEDLMDRAGNSQTTVSHTTTFPLISAASFISAGPNQNFGDDVGDVLVLNMSETVFIDYSSTRFRGTRSLGESAMSEVTGFAFTGPSCEATVEGSMTATVTLQITGVCTSAATAGTPIPGGISGSILQPADRSFMGVNPTPALLTFGDGGPP